MPWPFPKHASALLLGAASLLSISLACTRPGSDLPGRGDDADRTVLYRDTWGVAHIYAPTVEAGLYAQGWAQAEDRPQQLLLNMMMATGELAAAVGEAGIDADLRSLMWDHYGVAKRKWDELRPELREHVTAFAAGINDFYAAHPEDVPEWWQGRQVDPQMVIAFGRLFLYNWSIDEAYGDLERGGVEPGYTPVERGSNQFAIAPARSAEGAAILAIDPHLAWDGPSRFWEFRIHAGELQGSGVTLAGAPYIGLGHTRHLAWANTTGGPDTADVYALALDSASVPDPATYPSDAGQGAATSASGDGEHRVPRYRYDGEWRDLTSREVTLEVRDGEPQRRTLWFSHHGPIVAWRDGKAYAAKSAYAELANVNELWLELNFGTDYQAAVRGMEALSVFPQNVMVADTSGHIYYQRTGRVPRRPDGHDWTVPVDGSTSATEWQGVHPASDHLQVLDPPQGWMQNCNIPPDAMMPDSPFELDGTTDYLFGSLDYGPRSGWTNQRGARAVELLAADESVTAEEAIAYVNDVEPFGAARWIEALATADAAVGTEQASHPHYRVGLEALRTWDRRLEHESRGALVYDYWRHQLLADLGEEALTDLAAGIDHWYAIVSGVGPPPVEASDSEQRALVTALARGMDRLVENHGDGDAVYGDRYRVGRGERSWPVDGGGGNRLVGTTTLRNMGFTSERDDKTRWGRSGQTSTQVVVLSDPPRSWAYLPWGQSDRPESPHYSDQAEKLFAPRQLKPSWWLPEDLAGNIESRTVLEGAPAKPAT